MNNKINQKDFTGRNSLKHHDRFVQNSHNSRNMQKLNCGLSNENNKNLIFL